MATDNSKPKKNPSDNEPTNPLQQHERPSPTAPGKISGDSPGGHAAKDEPHTNSKDGNQTHGQLSAQDVALPATPEERTALVNKAGYNVNDPNEGLHNIITQRIRDSVVDNDPDKARKFAELKLYLEGKSIF